MTDTLHSAGAMTEAEMADALARFIADNDGRDAGFDALARQLFAYQYARNAPYRRFCDALGASPRSVAHWTEIPAAPAAAFKRHELSCTPVEAAARVFHSSGTTGRAAGRHILSPAALGLYDLSLRRAFRRMVFPDGAHLPLWALMPSPEAAPESSLSYMLGSLMAADAHPRHRFFWGDAGPDVPALAAALQAADEPVLLFGTAFAWVLFFDAADRHFPLPSGSRVLETGGFKGRSREVPREELYAFFTDRLGVPDSHCLSEYGMSEMCSQFYDSALLDGTAGRCRPRRKIGPHWTRTRVLDPRTGLDAAPGEPGVLCHYDLANLNSVLALRTEYMGIARDEGFDLLGRAPGSELRGCSLTAEEWHSRA